jgi:hypothetical protein
MSLFESVPPSSIPEKTEISRDVEDNTTELNWSKAGFGISLIAIVAFIGFTNQDLFKNSNNFVIKPTSYTFLNYVASFFYILILIPISILSNSFFFAFGAVMTGNTKWTFGVLLTLFVFIASSISWSVESKLDLNDQESKNTLYKHRQNEKYAFSTLALIVSLVIMGTIVNGPNADYSIITWLAMFIINLVVIALLSYASSDLFIDAYSDTIETATSMSVGIVMLIYGIAMFYFNFMLGNEISGFGIFGIFLIIIAIIILSISGINKDYPDYNFDVLADRGNNSSNNYSCKIVNRDITEVGWGDKNNVKINFDVNLHYLINSGTLLTCGSVWSVKYDKPSQTIILDYQGKTITIPIDGNVVITPTSAPTSDPVLGVDKKYILNVTMIVKTYEDTGSNKGTIVFYSDKAGDQDIKDNSLFLESVTPPKDWGDLVVNQYLLVSNLQYCIENENNFESMSSGNKIMLITLISFIGFFVIISLIDERTRKGIIGYEILPKWASTGKQFTKLMQ